MDKKELEKLYKDFTLQLVLSKNLDDIGLIAITKNQLKQIIKIIKHYNQIQTQVKKQQEVIDKAINILKDNFVYDYVRSCDTTDGVGYDEIDTECFTYRVYELLKEVSE